MMALSNGEQKIEQENNKLKKLILQYEKQLKLLEKKLRIEQRKSKQAEAENVRLKIDVGRMQSILRNK